MIFSDIIVIIIKIDESFVVNVSMLIRLSKTVQSPSFMETEFSLPCEKQHATAPYPE
jgi:hypothetical protein